METKEKGGLFYPTPCPHCGKINENEWCYNYTDKKGQLYSVCKRGDGPGRGWKETDWRDKEGDKVYRRDESVKQKRRPGTKEWTYKKEGVPLVRVVRRDEETEKRRYFQQRWNGTEWKSGLGNIERSQIPIYKLDEVTEAITQKETIFIAEGEGCADILIHLGLTATTNIGGAGKWNPSDTDCLMGATEVVLVPDRDKKGLAHMESIERQLSDRYPNIQTRWLYPFPKSDIWFDLPISGGLDVADWVDEWGVNVETLLASVSEKRPITEIEEDTTPTASENLILKALAALYSDKPWMSLDGALYYWNGTHYGPASREEELARIWGWLENTPRQVEGNWLYDPTPAKCHKIYESAVIKFGIDPGVVNPPGLNCLNGVVKLRWMGMVAEPELVSHSPDCYYTYVSEIIYDPGVSEDECDRLLQCLEPQQQRILLQTLAASLDLEMVRKYRGRMVRAILCQGQGNNGKDAVREVVRTIYGRALANASLSDFQAYDTGRKFTLSKLDGVAVNWCSENTEFTSLDSLQSLKAAITGDPLDMEKKGRDERPMSLNTVFMFNINKAPLLKGGLEAITSRWAVLDFAKTFKTNADISKGEIEADPRFRYDPEFIKTKVAPAFLNKMLGELQNLCHNGINYETTDNLVRDIKSESNHLWRFCYETGFDYYKEGRAYIADIWERLEIWYRENGTLEISEDGKKVWHDQPRRGDKNCKAINQVCSRFLELFPKAKRCIDRSDFQNKIYLSGVDFKDGNFNKNSDFNNPNNDYDSDNYFGGTDENTNFSRASRDVSNNNNSDLGDCQNSYSNAKKIESSAPSLETDADTSSLTPIALEPLQLKEKLPSHCHLTAVALPSHCPTMSAPEWGPEEINDLAEMMRNIETEVELDAFLDTFKNYKEHLRKASVELGKLDYDAYRRISEMVQKKSPYNQTVESEDSLLVDDSKLDLSYSPNYQIKLYESNQNLKPYDEVKKLYLDIETTGLEPKENRVIAVGLWDGNNEPILITDADEKAILNRFLETVEKLKSELVIGHNIFEFDLPFLKTRGSWQSVEMPFKNEYFPSGTGGAWVPPIMEKTITSSSMNGKPVVFHPIKWTGVQIIDTMQQAAIYEKSANTLTSFNLKNLVIDLGLRSDRRLELNHQEILQCWQSGSVDKILEYLRFDLEDTKLLADLFLPQVYYQSEVVPMPLQDLATASPAKKWQSILELHYGKRHRRVEPDPKLRYEGGYVDVNPGLYRNAAKIDVSSMYPSIQLLYGLCSRKDSDRHYLSVLQYLKDARLELKQRYKETGDKKYHAQQNAFKILINGGYGFSGTGGYSYNCMQTAALVTAYGRQLIKLMIETLESVGAVIIEVDTDGIFFSHSEPDNCLETVQRSLPNGIDIELEAKNCSIYVPKKKNYIIYKPDGSVKVSGQFRSINRCKLFKDFVVEYVRLMLQSNNEADVYYNNLCQQLALGNYPIEELSITQRIPRGDKTLQANNLGKIGDIITYWWGGTVTKRGAVKRKPTNSESYLPEYYVKELAGLKRTIDEVVKANAS